MRSDRVFALICRKCDKRLVSALNLFELKNADGHQSDGIFIRHHAGGWLDDKQVKFRIM